VNEVEERRRVALARAASVRRSPGGELTGWWGDWADPVDSPPPQPYDGPVDDKDSLLPIKLAEPWGKGSEGLRAEFDEETRRYEIHRRGEALEVPLAEAVRHRHGGGGEAEAESGSGSRHKKHKKKKEVKPPYTPKPRLPTPPGAEYHYWDEDISDARREGRPLEEVKRMREDRAAGYPPEWAPIGKYKTSRPWVPLDPPVVVNGHIISRWPEPDPYPEFTGWPKTWLPRTYNGVEVEDPKKKRKAAFPTYSALMADAPKKKPSPPRSPPKDLFERYQKPPR
jgi:hypothetical protein